MDNFVNLHIQLFMSNAEMLTRAGINFFVFAGVINVINIINVI